MTAEKRLCEDGFGGIKMNIAKLIEHLERPACEACPCQANCEAVEEFGCLLLEAAAALKKQQVRIEMLEKTVVGDNQAAFILGQMDMREKAAAMLRDAASGTYGITRAAVRIAADMVDGLETLDIKVQSQAVSVTSDAAPAKLVCDFDEVYGDAGLSRILSYLDSHGYKLICVTHVSADKYLVFFRRPAP